MNWLLRLALLLVPVAVYSAGTSSVIPTLQNLIEQSGEEVVVSGDWTFTGTVQGVAGTVVGTLQYDDLISTVDGIEDTFTLSTAPAVGSLHVVVDGLTQLQGTDYNLTEATLVMTTPPGAGTYSFFAFYATKYGDLPVTTADLVVSIGNHSSDPSAHFAHATSLTELNTQLGSSIADGAHTIDTDTFVTGKDLHTHSVGDGAPITEAALSFDVATQAELNSHTSISNAHFNHAITLFDLNAQISASIADGPHTTDTNAGTICGTDEFLDGDGICVQIANLADLNTQLGTNIADGPHTLDTNSAMFSVYVNNTTNLGTYDTLGAYIYGGSTNHGAPSSAIWQAFGTGTAVCDFRLYDATNALTIAESIGQTNTNPLNILDLGALSNVPTGRAVWEIQVRKTGGGGGDRCEIKSAVLEWY